jgi:hypothetical protein
VADLYNKANAEKLPEPMKAAIVDFFGNEERLHKEWLLCNREYRSNLTLSQFSGATFDQKLPVKKLADYWSRRKVALESALPAEVIASWKEAAK